MEIKYLQTTSVNFGDKKLTDCILVLGTVDPFDGRFEQRMIPANNHLSSVAQKNPNIPPSCCSQSEVWTSCFGPLALMFFTSWQLGMFCQDQWKLGQWLKDSRIPTKKFVMKFTGLFRFIYFKGKIFSYFHNRRNYIENLSNNWRTIPAVKWHFSPGTGERPGNEEGWGRLSVLNRSEEREH